MRKLEFRMWDYEAETFYHNLLINDCQYDGNVEYQQFTGFKDSEDKDIFEGDILRWEEIQSWEEGGRTIIGYYVVQWDENRGQWMLHDPFENSHREMYDTQYEYIVGNICENKALLPCEDDVD